MVKHVRPPPQSIEPVWSLSTFCTYSVSAPLSAGTPTERALVRPAHLLTKGPGARGALKGPLSHISSAATPCPFSPPFATAKEALVPGRIVSVFAIGSGPLPSHFLSFTSTAAVAAVAAPETPTAAAAATSPASPAVASVLQQR